MAKFRWNAVPAQRSSAAVLRAKLWLVLGVLIFASLCGLLAMFAWLTNDSSPTAVTVPTATATGAATTVANEFVNGQAITVPVASGLEDGLNSAAGQKLAGANSVAWNGFELVTQLNRNLEIHHFVIGGDPPRQLDVTLELTPNGPVVAADPTLLPYVGPKEPSPPFDWTDAEQQATITSNLRRVTTEWAQAYATNSRQDLRDLTGDLRNRTYPGLGGFTAENTQVLSAVPALGTKNFVVRARVHLNSAEGFDADTEYDLLVSNLNTASPKILAWGPAGSGGSLQPYQNAVGGALVGSTGQTPTNTTP